MAVPYDFKGFAGDIYGFGNVVVGEGSVDEMVVVICEKYSSANTFRYPFLM